MRSLVIVSVVALSAGILPAVGGTSQALAAKKEDKMSFKEAVCSCRKKSKGNKRAWRQCMSREGHGVKKGWDVKC